MESPRGNLFTPTVLYQRAVAFLFLSLLCSRLEAAPNYDFGGDFPELQAAFEKFPLFRQTTNDSGELAFQTLPLNRPVEVNGRNYYGFRFTVPPRTNQEDFVWTFTGPQNSFHWYIIPEQGDMSGFANFHPLPRTNYEATEHLFPLAGKRIYLQRLPGKEVEDGKTYLIWFSFEKNKPARMSLKFTFASVATPRKNELGALEKALGLVRTKDLHRPPREDAPPAPVGSE